MTVRTPFLATRSLIPTGTPASGPTSRPAARTASIRRPSRRAASGVGVQNACSTGSRRSMRSSVASMTSTGDRRRARISSARRTASIRPISLACAVVDTQASFLSPPRSSPVPSGARGRGVTARTPAPRPSAPVDGEGVREPLRRDRQPRVLDDAGDLLPVEVAVEANAEPAAVADVRRHEVVLGRGVDERMLHALGRGAPQRQAPVVVVVVVVHDEAALVADEEGGRAVAGALARLRQREAQLADASSATAATVTAPGGGR